MKSLCSLICLPAFLPACLPSCLELPFRRSSNYMLPFSASSMSWSLCFILELKFDGFNYRLLIVKYINTNCILIVRYIHVRLFWLLTSFRISFLLIKWSYLARHQPGEMNPPNREGHPLLVPVDNNNIKVIDNNDIV